MNIRKDLFKIFQENKDDYYLYEKTVKYIEETIEDIKGNENAKFYTSIRKLLNSINNAGWKERHYEQIESLWDIQRQIEDKYEKYLP